MMALGSQTSSVKRAAWIIASAAFIVVCLRVAFWATPKIVTDLSNVVALSLAFGGLVLLTHYLGLLSLGQGAFVGVGAYAALHAVNDFGAPVLWMPLAGLLAGTLVGAVVAIPSLRLPKAYLALLTLSLAVAYPIILRQIDGNLPVTLNGAFVAPSWTGIAENDEHIWEFFIVSAYVAVTLFFVQGLLRGPIGRAFIASRDQPEAARAFGIPVYRLRLYGVALSGGMAGLAGGLLMIPTNFNDYTHFPEELSIKMFALAMAFGGSRLISAVPGAVVLIFLPVWLIDRNWVVEYGWVGLVKSEGFIYAALLLATAYLTKGKGFMHLFERRQPKSETQPSNRRVTSVVRGLVDLDEQLVQLEGLVGDRPAIRSRQETKD
ncbi:MAG: branched-chain amino acid ABC transporter permease [Acidimicrobiales bacterium]|nr:MAG: branched-chain amino acid ABC transporter permease [Acidimicrobiales bacterium]